MDSTRCFVALALAVLSGCHADQSVTTLSERYRVCANLPLTTSFLPAPPGPDFDLGKLEAEGLVIDVFIGGHPRFSHQVINKGIGATDGFKLLGRERSDEQDKVLFAYERGDEEGPIYVMFMNVVDSNDAARLAQELRGGRTKHAATAAIIRGL